jgi:hypothetical protein
MGAADVELLNAEGQTNASFSERVFLQQAESEGAVLEWEDETSMDVMMAFSERYWRGGSAGEGEKRNNAIETFSPAGSRLKNFKEKTSAHHRRFNSFLLPL